MPNDNNKTGKRCRLLVQIASAVDQPPFAHA